MHIFFPSKSGPRYPVAWVRLLFSALLVAAAFILGWGFQLSAMLASDHIFTQFFVFMMIASFFIEWFYFWHQWGIRRFYLKRRYRAYFISLAIIAYVIPSFLYVMISKWLLPDWLLPDFTIDSRWVSLFVKANFLVGYIWLLQILSTYQGQYLTDIASVCKNRQVYINMLDIGVIEQVDGQLKLSELNGDSYYHIEIKESLEDFCKRLDPYYFFQINDDTIINRKAIKEVHEIYEDDDDNAD